MPYTLEETGAHARTAHVDIPKEDIDARVDRELRKLAGRVKIRGFRKGKVPMSVMRKRYADSVVQDVINELVNGAINDIVSEVEDVLYVDQPQVREGSSPETGVSFDVTVEVRPDIDPIGYLGLAVERPRVEVSTEDIDSELEQMRKHFSSLEPIPMRTTIKEGDVVTMDVEPADADSDFEELRADDLQWTVEQGTTALDGLVEALIGKGFTDEFTTKVTIADNFPIEERRGEQVDINVTVKSVKHRVLPDLDDEFAADTGEAETLLELRQKVRQALEAQQEHAAGHLAENDLLERLVGANDFDLPERFVTQQIDNRIRGQLQRMAQQGMQMPQNLDVESLRSQLREETEEQLRAEFLLIAIAQKENVQVEEDDLKSYFGHLAMHSNSTPEQVARHYLSDNNRRQQAMGGALIEKTVRFLLDKADIKEVDWPEEDAHDHEPQAKPAKKESKAKKGKQAKATPKAEASSGGSADDFKALKVDELKELLKANDLPVSGKKADLIDRLVEAGVSP